MQHTVRVVSAGDGSDNTLPETEKERNVHHMHPHQQLESSRQFLKKETDSVSTSTRHRYSDALHLHAFRDVQYRCSALSPMSRRRRRQQMRRKRCGSSSTEAGGPQPAIRFHHHVRLGAFQAAVTDARGEPEASEAR